MAIQVLGPLAVDGSGRLGPRDRSVLLALTVRQGQTVTPDELLDAVWGDRPPPSARKNLQSCVVRLRRALGADTIETTAQGYRLVVTTDDVDAARFEAQVERARELLAVGEPDRVAFQLEKALALWRGRAFADLPDWAPARREAGRLEELRMDAEELLLDAELRRGHARQALTRAHTMVRAAPLRERRWELLALGQYRTGAQGEALRSIRQLRAVLAGELGIDPSPEVVALEQAILRQDPTLLDGVEASVPSATCPWQGLRAYDVAEADRFFGRETEIEAGLTILEDGRLLALVGPSGSGKSSLMRAGIGARLQQRGTGCVTITPGRYPLHTLAALTDARPGDALLVDQAEEVFTLCEDPDETRAFLDRLVGEAAARPVVLALRADRMADLTSYAAFSRLVERGLYLVGGLDEAGMRQAVTEPARQAGLILEPGLVDLLVTEVRDDPGALPLLSHALLETWKRREGNTLTVDGYRASGGIHGAVAQSAERLYAQVEADHRPVLRGLVLRLLSPGSEGEPVRTRVPRRLIGTDPHHDRLIEMLVTARLVTSDDGVLEITHESLARAWPRLRSWLEDDVDGRRILHHLSSTADAWDTLGRPESELYRGVRLTRALDWRTSTGATLTTAERDFLDASRVQAVVEEQSAAERARTQARMIRRLRIVLGGAAALLVLALAAGGLAAVQSERANQNAAQAEQAAVSADARRVGLRSQLTEDTSLALLLAVAGARLEASPETRMNLATAISRNPRLIRSGSPGGGYLEALTVSEDGQWVAASDDQGWMHLYDATTNELIRSHEADPPAEGEPELMIGAFSPDSTQLAVVFEASKSTEPVRLLDPMTMRPTTTLDIPGDRPVWGIDIAFSADGRYLAATMHTSVWPAADLTGQTYALVWDLQSPSSPPVRIPTGRPITGLALSPNGHVLYTSEPLTAYDVATGERIWRRTHVAASYGAFDLSPDGTVLALADFDGPSGSDRDVLLVDVEDGATVDSLTEPTDEVWAIRFSPDGSLLGSLDSTGEIVVWDTATGLPRDRWQGADTGILGFSAGNEWVYNGYGTTMLRTWDLSLADAYLQRTSAVSDAETFRQADFSPDGSKVAYGWRDEAARGWVRFVDLVTGRATPPRRFPVWDAFRLWSNGAWHPDGQRYVGFWCDGDPVACKAPGTVTTLDPSTGRAVKERTDVVEGDGDIWALAYVDDGSSLLVIDSDTEGTVIDAETLRPVGQPYDIVEFCACSATPLADESTAMVWEWTGGGTSTLWRVLDTTTGKVLIEGDELDLLVHVSVGSPDGSTVAVAGETGEIVTLDVSTGHEERRSSSLGVPAYWLDYSDDGKLIVSGAEDGGVSLWDAATLDLLATVFPPHDGDAVPASVHFIGDSHDVAIASFDGNVYRWETDIDRALEFACQMAGRDLTEAEWAQYLPTQPYRSVCPDQRR